jgi:hypothetical protein
VDVEIGVFIRRIDGSKTVASVKAAAMTKPNKLTVDKRQIANVELLDSGFLFMAVIAKRSNSNIKMYSREWPK